jgi:hypothetical protein
MIDTRAAIVTQNTNVAPSTVEQAVANAMSANNQGVYINSNKIIQLFPLPDTFVFQVTNSNGADNVAITAYAFNEDTYNVTPTTNPVGDDAIVKEYGDGFDGKNYNKLLASGSNGNGVKFDSFNISYFTAANVANQSAFTVANFAILAYNGTDGESLPVNINLGRAARNTAQNNGLLTIQQVMWLNCVTQIKMSIPKGNVLSLTLNVALDQK